MGQNLFYFFARKNYRIHWIMRSNVEKQQKKYERKIKRDFKNELISSGDLSFKQKYHQIGNNLSGARQADLFIECIREELDAKRDLAKEIFAIKKAEALMATNSSSFLPDMLSDNEEVCKQIYGLHFFFPVEAKSIVELVRNEHSEKKDLDTLIEFLRENQRKVLVQSKEDALLLNRLMLHFQAGVFKSAEEQGMSLHEIDSAVKKHLMPMGVFEMMDFVGLDLIAQSAKTYLKDEKNQRHYSALLEAMQNLIAQGKNGQKSGGGFFAYPFEMLDLKSETEEKALALVQEAFATAFQWAGQKTRISKADLRFAMEEYLDTNLDNWNL